jgi:cell fate (sporulation/competence/biofilm development) regulator YlbF (YheA/YmcA/DUF963 family)
MAARLTIENEPGTPPLIPNREDDMESFWHVLLWIALRHCDYCMSGMKLADALGSLFDHKYIGETGQAYSGGSKEDSLKSRSHITQMKLASKVLHRILVDTAEVLATRYPSQKAQSQIEQVQQMWENLQRKSSALDKEALLKAELRQRIAHIEDDQLLLGYVSWENQHTPMDAAWRESADEGVHRVQQMWKAIESEYSQFRTTDIISKLCDFPTKPVVTVVTCSDV